MARFFRSIRAAMLVIAVLCFEFVPATVLAVDYVEPLKLNQRQVSIALSQKATLTASNGSKITAFSSSNVVKVVVKGRSITLTPVKIGSAKVTVCSVDAYCDWATVTVTKTPPKPTVVPPVKKPTVKPAAGPAAEPAPAPKPKTLALSRTSSSVAKWGSLDVLVSGATGVLNAQSNSEAVRTAINGNRVTLYGTEEGLATVQICDEKKICGSVRVLVTPIINGAFSISQTSVNMETDSTVWLRTLNSAGLTATINNTWVAGVKIKDGFILISSGSRTGSATVRVCSAKSDCILVYINVKQGMTSQTAYGSFKSVTVDVGQSVNIPFPSLYTASYNIIGSPANPSIAILEVNKDTFTVTGKSYGTAVFKLCPTSPEISCGTVGVTVKNTINCVASGNLVLSEETVSIPKGQNIEITASNCKGLVAISESDVVRTGVSGNRVTLYGEREGNTKVKVCDSNASCRSVLATVTTSQ